MAATVPVHVRCSSQQKFTVEVDTSSTVSAFKQQIAEQAAVPADQQRLIYKGRVLKDEETLASYSVEADQTIHLVRSSRPAAAPTTPAPAAAATSAGSLPAAPAAFGGLDANPFAAMMGAGASPDVSRMQQQLMSNPEMMQSIMNSPMMQNMLSNPDLVRNMVMNNPQMQRVLEQNPQLSHVLNDPAIMRQTLESMRNPAAMREMMRNQDLAMSNIESHPEGFNALRRMYQEVQEPMMEASADFASQQQQAMQGGQGSGNPAASQGGAFPNPWAAPGTTAGGSTGGSGAPAAAAAANPWAAMAGMGGVGGMGGMGGGMPDPAMVQQIMSDPASRQMMQQMFSDPAMIEQMVAMNPQLRNAMEANPQLREQMPQMLQSMSDPANLQAMIQMQQSMAQLQRAGVLPPGMGMPGMDGMMGGFRGMMGAPANAANPAVPAAPAGGLDFSALLGGAPAAAPPATGVPAAMPNWAAPVVPAPPNPEETYASQLTTLSDMGFGDRAANLRALISSQGNVNAAVERLLGGGS